MRWPTPSRHHRWTDAIDRWVCSWFPPNYLHEDGITYRIRRDTLEQDFTIEKKRDGAWVDCGLDQAVKDVNFAEFKRLGLLIKNVMNADQWLA